MFANIRNILKPGEYNPLAKIKIPRSKTSTRPTEPGEVHSILATVPHDELMWDTILSKTDIEDHLTTFNKEAFRAAAESPCGHGLIHDALTFTSISPAATKLLKGIVPQEWHGDDELLREFLASFTIPLTVQEADPIQTKITSADIKKGISSWKEATTTSPSGRHLGHYKAIVQDPSLLECMSKFLDIAVSRGISITRWQRAVNVMIEKDHGDPKINRLRIIHLFEADYNLFLKLMWGSRLVQRAVQLNLLNAGKHGSTPGKTTMEPIMLTQLTADMSRLLKVNYVRFDNDASACFDWIIVALGMLAARRCGMPIHAIRSHAKSLELMKYMVKTVHGVSSKSYAGTPFEPLFGTGQGSGASPAVWLTLVVLLLNTMERISPLRMSFASPDGINTHSRLVDAFVDDTALGFTDDGQISLEDLVSRLEAVAQTWERLLHFSGGSLNLAKCSWFVMYWDWRSGRPVLRAQEDSLSATVRLSCGGDNQKYPIKRQSLTKATRLLGVFQNPSGDFSELIQVLKAKADSYAAKLQSPRLTASDTRVFVRTMYEPAMRYSLPAIAIDEEELETIQTRIMPTIVQKLGMSSKLATAVRHGPISMGGLGLMDIRTECGIEMIKYFRHQVYGKMEVGELLIIQLKTLQLEAGIQEHLLEAPTIPIPYLTSTWLTSMCQFLSNHNLTISVSDVLQYSLQGSNDEYIMQPDRLAFYNASQQRDINLVRLYMQCTLLSDMSDATNPRCISNSFLVGERPSHFTSKTGWPRQERPSPKQRRLWKRFISSQYLRYGQFWKRRPTETLRDLKSRTRANEGSEASSLSISDQMVDLPKHQRRLLSHVALCATEEEVWKASRSRRRLTIATDGGLKVDTGTFGWTLSTHDNRTLYEGAGPVDGPRDVTNSTRCEIAGLAAPLLIIRLLTKQWGIKFKSSFRWVCDSKSAISNVNKHTSDQVTRRQPAYVDLLAQIGVFKTTIGKRIRPKWVKGHQTQKHSASNKDIARNNRADELATWFREQHPRLKSTEHMNHLPEERVSIWIQGVKQVSQVENCVRYHINGYHLRTYLQSRHEWTNEVWDAIDLRMLGQFCRSLTPGRQTAQTKFMYNQRNTGVQRHKVARIKDPKLLLCPCCLMVEETNDHVLQCVENPGRIKALQRLRQAFDSAGLLPGVKVLKDMVMGWLNSTPREVDMDEFPTLHITVLDMAMRQQTQIGWPAALRGFLSVHWNYAFSMQMGANEEVIPAKGDQITRKILRAFHNFSIEVWKDRNQKLHGETSNGVRELRCPDLIEITHLHSHPEMVSAGDRHFCDRPLESLLRAGHSARRRWIQYMRRARARYDRDGSKQTVITTYFRKR